MCGATLGEFQGNHLISGRPAKCYENSNYAILLTRQTKKLIKRNIGTFSYLNVWPIHSKQKQLDNNNNNNNSRSYAYTCRQENCTILYKETSIKEETDLKNGTSHRMECGIDTEEVSASEEESRSV